MKKFGSYQTDKNVYEFYKEPLFIQSEYFNVHFQKALEGLGNGLDLKAILSNSAQEVASSQFIRIFNQNEKLTIDERKRFVTEYYSDCGFGLLDLKSIQPKGGHIDIHHEHYASSWLKHFGKRDENLPGVGYFALGFLCGIVEAIFGTKPGTFDGKQLRCISQGNETSKFEIFRGFKKKLNPSPSMGKPPIILEDQDKPSGVVVDSFTQFVSENKANESGSLEWFDTTFTKHYVNYYALVEIKLLMQANKKLGPSGFKQIKKALTEVSQKNAYFSFGKVLNSDFWLKELSTNKDVKSSSEMKNCLDLLTAMGCGHWQYVETEVPKQYKVIVHNCPRTNAFLKLVGNTKAPIGFVNGSTLVGIANLLEKGAGKTEGIDTEFVNELASSNHFEYAESSSRMTGGDNDILIVSQT